MAPLSSVPRLNWFNRVFRSSVFCLHAIAWLLVLSYSASVQAQIFDLRPVEVVERGLFSTGVAIDSDTIAVGASGRESFFPFPGRQPGSVTLYEPDTGEVRTVIDSPAGFEQTYGRPDGFGRNVNVHGDRVVVGGRLGGAWLYDSSDGSLISELSASTQAASFGFGVGLDETHAIVRDEGMAHLFSAADGGHVRTLTFDSGFSGRGVAVDGNRAVVGATGTDSMGESTSAAYLFDTNTGAEITQLIPDGGILPAAFGSSVAINNGVVAVGSPSSDSATTSAESSSVYLFDASNGTQIGKLVPDEPISTFGHSVDLDNGLAIVGSLLADDVLLFDVATGQQINRFRRSEFQSRANRFGASVGIYDDQLVVSDYGGLATLQGPERALVLDASARLGDFNGDGLIDDEDIDFFAGNLGHPASFDQRLDWNGDGTLTIEDHDEYVTEFVPTFGGETGALIGDLDLDGKVDVFTDGFRFLRGLSGELPVSYANGNLNGDEVIDVFGDGFRFLSNLGQSNSAPATIRTSAVPEPGAGVVLLLFGFATAARRRRN